MQNERNNIEIDESETGIVIEVKYAHSADLEAECQKALAQIDDKDYTAQLREDGMRTIWKYGIACYKKKCKAAAAKEVVN